jgi:hypothetical protein
MLLQEQIRLLQAYLLLRLWILNKYHNHIEIPVITTDTIMTCVTSLFVKTNNTNGTNHLNEFNNTKHFFIWKREVFG